MPEKHSASSKSGKRGDKWQDNHATLWNLPYGAKQKEPRCHQNENLFSAKHSLCDTHFGTGVSKIPEMFEVYKRHGGLDAYGLQQIA